MTIRIRPAQLALDPQDQERLSALLTPVLLQKPEDDGAQLGQKAGVAWVRWGDSSRPVSAGNALN